MYVGPQSHSMTLGQLDAINRFMEPPHRGEYPTTIRIKGPTTIRPHSLSMIMIRPPALRSVCYHHYHLEGVISELLWSDPMDGISGFRNSSRGDDDGLMLLMMMMMMMMDVDNDDNDGC